MKRKKIQDYLIFYFDQKSIDYEKQRRFYRKLLHRILSEISHMRDLCCYKKNVNKSSHPPSVVFVLMASMCTVSVQTASLKNQYSRFKFKKLVKSCEYFLLFDFINLWKFSCLIERSLNVLLGTDAAAFQWINWIE